MPPVTQTRRTSSSVAIGSGTCSRTSLNTTVSKVCAGNGSESAKATTARPETRRRPATARSTDHTSRCGNVRARRPSPAPMSSTRPWSRGPKTRYRNRSGLYAPPDRSLHCRSYSAACRATTEGGEVSSIGGCSHGATLADASTAVGPTSARTSRSDRRAVLRAPRRAPTARGRRRSADPKPVSVARSRRRSASSQARTEPRDMLEEHHADRRRSSTPSAARSDARTTAARRA